MTSPKLRLIERKLGLSPKEFQPMSPNMDLIARRLKRGEKEPALDAATELAIQQAVDQRVREALEQPPVKQSPRVRELLRQFNAPAPDYRQLPPVQTPTKKPTDFVTTWHRDGAGQIAWAETVDSDGKRFVTKVERDGAGAIVRTQTTPPDESPVLPALDIDYKTSARRFNPGEDR